MRQQTNQDKITLTHAAITDISKQLSITSFDAEITSIRVGFYIDKVNRKHRAYATATCKALIHGMSEQPMEE